MNAKLFVLALIAIATVASTSNAAVAQEVTRSDEVVGSASGSFVVAPVPVPIDRSIYTPQFSSTNAEGLGRGLGALAEGIGEMNLYNSMAAANFEVARRRAIENRRLAVENHFAMRRVNQEYQESQLRRRGNMISSGNVSRSTRADPARVEVSTRDRSRSARVAPARAEVSTRERSRLTRTAPARAEVSTRDPSTGAIQWPKALLAPEYSSYRKYLESRVAPRSSRSTQYTAGTLRDVQKVTWSMKEQLRSQIRTMSPSEYLAAKKFIDSLASEYESRVPRERLAAR